MSTVLTMTHVSPGTGLVVVPNGTIGSVRKWSPLVAICTGTFMLLVDVTIVNVALPDMATDLGTRSASCSGWSTSTRWRWPPWCSGPDRWPTCTAADGST